MPDIDFFSDISTVFLLVAALLAFGLSSIVYATTIPPVSQRLRFVLIFLRGLGILFLTLLLGQPVLSLFSRHQEPPTTMVLIDNSRSMTIAGETGTSLQEIFSRDVLNHLSDIGAVRTVLFDGDQKPLVSFHPDSLTLNGDRTDIAGALRYARAEAVTGNIRAVVLISDGNATGGGSPLLEADHLGIPLFTLAVGDSTEQRDLVVRKVLSNTVAYAGTRVPVHAQILSSGFSGEHVEVLLTQDGVVLDRQGLTLEQGTREYSVRLSFVAETPGRQRFSVEVSELPGEITGRNNRSTFFVRILKSKVRALLLAGAPSPDVAFVRRAFHNDRNIDLTVLIEREGGRMDEGRLTTDLLASTDCVVMIGVPGRNTSSETLSWILTAAERGTSILFLPSRTLDRAKLRSLEPILPVLIQRPPSDEIQAFFHVPDFHRSHAVLKEPENASSAGWSVLPPLFSLRTAFRAKPEATVLAVSRIQGVVTDDPLLVLRSVGGRKSAALLGYGVWRWKMFSGDDRRFEQLLSNMIRWLTTAEDTRRVRVEPVNDLFTTQEPVEFSGHIYDESLQPIDDARVSIVITGNGERHQLSLTPRGHGQYEGMARPLDAGTYEYTATVEREGRPLSVERGTFSVGGVNVEFLETRTNTRLLRQLAARTGGAAVQPEHLAEAVSSLPGFQPREVTSTRHIELWNLPWSLSMLVALFSFEWFIRKRNGML